MVTPKHAVQALFSLILPLTGVASCNAVLGIEPAETDTQTGALVCDQPAHPVKVSCEDPEEECGACIGSDLIADCLADDDCRDALGRYRECLQDDCNDEDMRCVGCVTGSPDADRLRTALADCVPECAGFAIVSLCELYCHCMHSECTAQDWSERSCEAACAATAPWLTYCRWGHCERAFSPSDEHCDHAGPDTATAMNVTACTKEPFFDPLCEAGEIWDGYVCDDSRECCSGLCRDGKCVAN